MPSGSQLRGTLLAGFCDNPTLFIITNLWIQARSWAGTNSAGLSSLSSETGFLGFLSLFLVFFLSFFDWVAGPEVRNQDKRNTYGKEYAPRPMDMVMIVQMMPMTIVAYTTACDDGFRNVAGVCCVLITLV